MRVLFADSEATFGGGQTYLMTILRNIDRNEFEPVVALPCDSPLITPIRELQIETVMYKLDAFKGKWKAAPYLSPIRLIDTIKILKSLNVDIVHNNHYYMNKYFGLAARMCGIPSIWTVHNLYQYRFWERLFPLINNQLIGVSKAVLEKYGDNPKARVVYNGIDLKERNYYPPEVSRVFTFGILAKLIPSKGHTYLIEAVRHLRQWGVYDFKVIVAGSDRQCPGFESSLKQLAHSLGVASFFEFNGFVKDVDSLLENVDCVVLPSVSGEGFPISLLEAMSHSKPIIASRLSGIPEMIEIEERRSGELVVPGSSLELARSMRKLLENTELGDAYGRCGLDFVRERFNAKLMIRNLESSYRELAGR